MDTTDLFQAIRRGDPAAVRAALAEDPGLANARATSHRVPQGETEGWSPLHAAIEAGSLEIARTLVEAGADLEARTERERESRTPLHDSIEMGRTPLAVALAGIELSDHPQAAPEACKQRAAVAAILRAHGATEP